MVRRKVLCLRAETEGSSIVGRLRQELREYKEILKCSICLDRPKEVNMQFWFSISRWQLFNWALYCCSLIFYSLLH